MGTDKIQDEFAGEERHRFMRQLLRDVRALEVMLSEGMLEEGVRRIGAEQELFLVDSSWHPAPAALRILERIEDPHYTTELGLFNLEMNLDPQLYGGACLSTMEKQLREGVERARRTAAELGWDVVLAGILPTIRKSDLGMDMMTPKPRYLALNHAMAKLRGGVFEFQIKGLDELLIQHDSVMLEACNCSFQVHFQVGAREFANLYNLAQAIAAPVLAAATNSPMLFGHRLWAETRIALFQQAVDTRKPGLHARPAIPRVNFGSRWVQSSVLELYKEDVARFRTLVGTTSEEDPFETLSRGETPELHALRLHNGTVYRWNRACYGITDGKPHLRIENRVLPSGPSIVDEVANAALWFGLMGALASRYEDITRVFDFEHAKLNFLAAARQGLGAQFTWLDGQEVAAPRLLLDTLLPMAAEGLDRRGIDARDRDRYLGIIERRVASGRTGSRWLVQSLAAMKDEGTPGERLNALTAATISRQRGDQPVSDWEPARLDEAGGSKHNYFKVEQYMQTDLFTVHVDESLDLVANLMDWQRIRYVLVEDLEHRLVGLVSYRSVLRLFTAGKLGRGARSVSLADIMKKDPVTVTPETTTLDAIRLMRRHRIGCLPVVHGGRLVGVVTESHFLDIARDLLEEKLQE
jgi:CBS domain-containing protein